MVEASEMFYDVVELLAYDKERDDDMLAHLRQRGSVKDFLKAEAINNMIDEIEEKIKETKTEASQPAEAPENEDMPYEQEEGDDDPCSPQKLLNELMGSSTKSEDALKEQGAEEDRGA